MITTSLCDLSTNFDLGIWSLSVLEGYITLHRVSVTEITLPSLHFSDSLRDSVSENLNRTISPEIGNLSSDFFQSPFQLVIS